MSVTAVAQLKIMREPTFLREAAEQLLGKTEQEIQTMLLHTLEGHLRAIVNTLTVEELNKWRKKCAESVQVGRPGSVGLSFQVLLSRRWRGGTCSGSV